jgi:hypothetical protein
MTKDELLAAVRTDRAALDALVGRIDDGRMEAPGPDGGWSVKHHLSHVAAWERMIVAHLTDRSAHTYACMTPEQYVHSSLDELNARLHDQHADEGLADVRKEYGAAHDVVVGFLEAMPEARLGELYWGDDAAQRTVLEKVSGDTYLHYREHTQWISELLAAGVNAP